MGWTKKPWEKIRGAFGRVGGGFAWAAGGVKSNVGKAGRSVGGGVGKVFEAPRQRVSSATESARERPAIWIGIAAGALVGIAWIGWAIYVSAENGMNAGLGVLLSWPVLLGALALVAAPFILTAMLVQRMRNGSEPALAGGGGGVVTTEQPAAEKPAEEEPAAERPEHDEPADEKSGGEEGSDEDGDEPEEGEDPEENEGGTEDGPEEDS